MSSTIVNQNKENSPPNNSNAMGNNTSRPEQVSKKRNQKKIL
jgi:hypothetical protein